MSLTVPLIIAFLFAVGSMGGWCIEVIFRRFFSKKNPERKWLNPGFCLGPYLPLYGFGLVVLFFLSYFGEAIGYGETALSKVILFFVMALMMTLLELIAGILCTKVFKMKLWDYSKEWGNFMGIICPKFTLFWALLSAAYYFLVQPNILDSLYWLAAHLTFSFFVGLFYGVFIIDVIVSSGVAVKIRAYAKENNIVVNRGIHGTQGIEVGGFGKGLLNFFYNSRVHSDKKKDSAKAAK